MSFDYQNYLKNNVLLKEEESSQGVVINIPDKTPNYEFAKAVAKALRDNYSSYTYQQFMDALEEELNRPLQEDSSPERDTEIYKRINRELDPHKEGVSVEEIANYIYDNFNWITGRQLNDRDAPIVIPDIIHDILNKYGVDKDEFEPYWSNMFS